MATEAGTLEGLLKQNGIGAEILPVLANPPLKITKISDLANHFDTKAEVKKWTENVDMFKDNGDLLANFIFNLRYLSLHLDQYIGQ